MCAVCAFALPANAQQRIQIGDLIQRIDRLESEVTRLRVAPRAGGGGDVARLDQIEAELRRLTGIIERLDYENRKAARTSEARMDGLQERIESLEGRASGPSVASREPSAPGPSYPPNLTRPGLSGQGGAAQYAPQASLAPPPPPPTNVAPETYSPTAAQPNFGAAPGKSADVLYSEGVRLLNVGSFDEAGARFEDLIATHPQDPKAGQAQYWLGEMHFRLGRFEQAANAFLESFRNWPEGPKAPDSLLKLGMTLANIGKTEEACLSFKQVSARYPGAAAGLLRRAQIEGQRNRCGS